MKEVSRNSLTARIWFQESPPWGSEILDPLEERSLPASYEPEHPLQSVAVEMRQTAGPVVPYGALGATFFPAKTGYLIVRSGRLARQGQAYQDALTFAPEFATMGLPEDLLKEVLLDMTQSNEIHMLGSGILLVQSALHNDLGSSRMMFQRISRSVIRLLCLHELPASDDEMLALLH